MDSHGSLRSVATIGVANVAGCDSTRSAPRVASTRSAYASRTCGAMSSRTTTSDPFTGSITRSRMALSCGSTSGRTGRNSKPSASTRSRYRGQLAITGACPRALSSTARPRYGKRSPYDPQQLRTMRDKDAGFLGVPGGSFGFPGSLPQSEVHRDRHDDRHGHAVEQRRGELPLTHGVYRRLIEPRHRP